MSNLCFAESAQEISIPGYNPNAPTYTQTQTTIQKTAPLAPKKPDDNAAATEDQLQNFITAINLSGWSQFALYLWTCTPNSYSIPTYDAKNRLRATYDDFKKKKKFLSLKKAKQLAGVIGAPVNHSIPGLLGNACHFKIDVSSVVKNPYILDCFTDVIDARYFSLYGRKVYANNGKEELLDKETYALITDLLKKHCKKT